MQISETNTHSANGSTYKSVKVTSGKTTVSVMLVEGKLNYVSVRKHVPGSTLGKEFKNFNEAQSSYKNATFKNILLMAEEALIRSLNPFKVHIENMDSGAPIRGCLFTKKEDALKFRRSLISQFKLVKHAGHVVNYSKRVELFTNF